jgi:polyphenol oxidase
VNERPLLFAGWPAPPGVHAFTTLRHGAGISQPPFDDFNLGNRYAADGDDAVAVERNRASLIEHVGLPSAPHWLKQVHGVDVVRCRRRRIGHVDAGRGARHSHRRLPAGGVRRR